MTRQPNLPLIQKLRGSLMCLAYSFGMLYVGCCTTRYWQMSGHLVQELNICTVMNYAAFNSRTLLHMTPNRQPIGLEEAAVRNEIFNLFKDMYKINT